MKIHLYTFCYNEQVILPFFIRHYRPWVERLVVYDNGSTDDSRRILAADPTIEVRSWDTGGEMRDDLKMQLSNSMWKESRGLADWVIVCDMDEFLYHPDLPRLLVTLKEQDYTICKPLGFDMLSTNLPREDQAITAQINEGVRRPEWDKLAIFDPNQIQEINYGPGNHTALPEGKVRAFFKQQELLLLHYRYLSERYILEKHKMRASRLSAINKKMGWGQQYGWDEEKQLAVYNQLLQLKKRVIN